MSLTPLAEKFLNHLKALGKDGELFNQEDLLSSGISPNQTLQVTKELMDAQRLKSIEEETIDGRKIVRFELVDEELWKKLAGLGNDHYKVYEIVSEGGAKGVILQQIVRESGMNNAMVRKALRSLVYRKIIKEVKNVQDRNRIVYMLYELVPDTKVSGGSWYHDGEFDFDRIDEIVNLCLVYMTRVYNNSAVTKANLLKYITETVNCSPSELDEVLFVLVQDGTIVSAVDPRDPEQRKYAYRQDPYCISHSLTGGGFTSPCIDCPLVSECRPGGIVNPDECPYLRVWVYGKLELW